MLPIIDLHPEVTSALGPLTASILLLSVRLKGRLNVKIVSFEIKLFANVSLLRAL